MQPLAQKAVCGERTGPTDVQLAILRQRFPGIGEPTLRRNYAALLGQYQPAIAVQVAEHLSKPRILARAKETAKAGQWLTLPYPPSANKYWRSIVIKGQVRVLVSKEARNYKKAVQDALAGTMPMMDGPIGISVRIYRPIRRGDLGNRIKVLEDALQGVLFANDDQIEHIDAQRFDDKHNPRAEICVWPSCAAA